MEKVTALEAFRQLLPAILAWKQSKKISDLSGLNIHISGDDSSIERSGKRNTWNIHVFAPMRNQQKIFSFPDELSKKLQVKTNLSELEARQQQSYQLLDSDWVVQKALELGLVLDENDNLQAHLSGQVAWSAPTGYWKFIYHKNVSEEWEMTLNLSDGKLLTHKLVRTLPPVSVEEKSGAVSNFTFSRWIQFSSDGNLLASGNGNGTVQVVNLADKRTIFSSPKSADIDGLSKQNLPINNLAFSNNNKYLAISQLVTVNQLDHAVQIWHTANWQPLANFGETVETLAAISPYDSFEVTALAFSHDDKYLVVGTASGKLLVWDIQNRKKISEFVAAKGSIMAVAFDITTNHLVSVDANNIIKSWEVETGKNLYSYTGFKHRITSATILHNATTIAASFTSNESSKIYLQKLSSGNFSQAILEVKQPITALTLNKTGTKVAVGYQNGQIQIRDEKLDQLLFASKVLTSPIYSLAIHPAEQQIAISSQGLFVLNTKQNALSEIT